MSTILIVGEAKDFMYVKVLGPDGKAGGMTHEIDIYQWEDMEPIPVDTDIWEAEASDILDAEEKFNARQDFLSVNFPVVTLAKARKDTLGACSRSLVFNFMKDFCERFGVGELQFLDEIQKV